MVQPACNIETTQLLKQSETIKLDIMIIELRYFYITLPSANSIFSCGNCYLYQMSSLKSQSQVILEKNIKKNGVGDTIFRKTPGISTLISLTLDILGGNKASPLENSKPKYQYLYILHKIFLYFSLKFHSFFQLLLSFTCYLHFAL